MKKTTSIFSARLGLTLAATAAFICYASPATAQVENATGIADPGRIEGTIREGIVSPDVSPRIEVKDQIVQKAPQGAENINLTLRSVQLDGVTVYSESDLAPAYQDQIGQTISLAEVYAIAGALTSKYRNDGYILTQVVVPPQTIEGGAVRLQVVEGFVGNVGVQGEENAQAAALINKYAGQIQTGGALNVRDLERWLLLINDLPGVEARSVLSPSKTQAGAADLRVILERDPWDAMVSIDNYGSRFLGPIQVAGAASANSYFGNNERITGQVVLAPELGVDSRFFELGYFAASYEQPIWNRGTVIEVLGSHTNTRPGHSLAEFDVEGRSNFASVKVTHPVIRSRTTNLYANLGFDARNVNSKNNIEDTRRDRIRAIRAGGRVEILDTLLGLLGVGINTANVEVSRGVDILGASDKGENNLTRPQGDPTFTKVEGGLQRLQRLTSNVNLLLAGRGQYSANKLLSSEEFGIGGINSVRAYDPSEIIGEHGIEGKAEVQWNEPYPVEGIENYQLFTFFDAGRIWDEDSTTNDLERESVTSAGFGVRADITTQTQAGAAVAFPLNRDVEANDDQDPRFYVNLSRKF
ncbi:MAG TPA: ShlB/FhaC/HecB family hemolysin secretion/activation protein [Rhodospirillaceae bacterium]|nr:ShlB/FhaC/HecB family hemolysin secretion/activation protein [Rhodospirillaceae bacterium]